MGLFRQPSWSRSRISLHRHKHRDSPPSPTPPLPPSLVASDSPGQHLARTLSHDSVNTPNTGSGIATPATPKSSTPEPESEMSGLPSYIRSDSLGLSTASAPPVMGRGRSRSTGHPSPSYGNPRPLGAPVSPRLSPKPSPRLSPQPRPLMPPGEDEEPDTADTCTFCVPDRPPSSPSLTPGHAHEIPYLSTHNVDIHPDFMSGDMLLLAGDRGFRCHSALLRGWSGVFAQQLRSDRFARDRVLQSPDSAEDVHSVLSFLYGTAEERAAVGLGAAPPAGGLGLLPSIQVEEPGFTLSMFRAVLDFADGYDVLPALRDLIAWTVDAEAKRLCANRPGHTDVLGLAALAHKARSAGLWKELIRRAWPKPDGIGYRPPGPEWKVMTAPQTLDEGAAGRLGSAMPLLLLVARVQSATGSVAVAYEKDTAIVTGGKEGAEFRTTLSV